MDDTRPLGPSSAVTPVPKVNYRVDIYDHGLSLSYQRNVIVVGRGCGWAEPDFRQDHLYTLLTTL